MFNLKRNSTLKIKNLTNKIHDDYHNYIGNIYDK